MSRAFYLSETTPFPHIILIPPSAFLPSLTLDEYYPLCRSLPSLFCLRMPQHTQQSTKTTSAQPKVWVDPASLPNHGDISDIGGNADDYIKQLNINTYISYGVGSEDTFGYKVGKSVRFVDISLHRNEVRNGKTEATTVAEIMVTKGLCVFFLSENEGVGRETVAAALQTQVTE